MDDYNVTREPFVVPALMPLALFTLPLVYERIVSPVSKDYFRRTREAQLGKKLEEVEPIGKEREEAWNQVKKCFDIVDDWLQKKGDPYALGEQGSFVEFSSG